MEKSKFTKTGTMFPLAVLCCALWGSAFPSIKLGYKLFSIESFDTFSQILFAGTRFAIAGFAIIIATSIAEKRFIYPKTKKSVLKVGIVSLFQTVLQYIFFYIGLAHTSGVKSSVIGATSGFFALIVSCFIFRQEKINSKKIIGCLIGFAGAVIINISKGSLSGGFSVFGEGAIILSSLACAFSHTFVKKFSADENPTMISGYQFFFGGIFMMAFGLLFGGRIHFYSYKCVLILLYLAFISAMAFSVWSILIKYNPISKMSSAGFMTPVFGVILSAIFIGEGNEAFNFKSILALLLVSLGIIIVNWNFNKKEKGNQI